MGTAVKQAVASKSCQDGAPRGSVPTALAGGPGSASGQGEGKSPLGLQTLQGEATSHTLDTEKSPGLWRDDTHLRQALPLEPPPQPRHRRAIYRTGPSPSQSIGH